MTEPIRSEIIFYHPSIEHGLALRFFILQLLKSISKIQTINQDRIAVNKIQINHWSNGLILYVEIISRSGPQSKRSPFLKALPWYPPNPPRR